MKHLWREVERLLGIAQRAKAVVTQSDGDDPFTWDIAEKGADAERLARWLAEASGCERHIRIPRA